MIRAVASADTCLDDDTIAVQDECSPAHAVLIEE